MDGDTECPTVMSTESFEGTGDPCSEVDYPLWLSSSLPSSPSGPLNKGPSGSSLSSTQDDFRHRRQTGGRGSFWCRTPKDIDKEERWGKLDSNL